MVDLTILIPCFESPRVVEFSISNNEKLFSSYPVLVVNKKGGDLFKMFALIVFDQKTSWWFARRFGLEFVKTKYVLNLDVDTTLPEGYVEKAIEILEAHPDIGAVALDYNPPQGHLAFGTSVWRTEQLKELYDWRLTEEQQGKICECKYMWDKVAKKGLKVETLPMKAIHHNQKTYIPEKPYNSGEC